LDFAPRGSEQNDGVIYLTLDKPISLNNSVAVCSQESPYEPPQYHLAGGLKLIHTGIPSLLDAGTFVRSNRNFQETGRVSYSRPAIASIHWHVQAIFLHIYLWEYKNIQGVFRNSFGYQIDRVKESQTGN
jgi:hypothetical protein